MSPQLTTSVVVLKSLSLLLGGLITHYSYTAYRRTNSTALGALAIGFGIITVGALMAGVFDQLLPVNQSIALAIESVFTTAGFGLILYSLYAD